MHDFLIVGGGVIGLSIAWELAGRGARVCVTDRAQVGRGASWAGAGILPPPKRLAKHDPVEQLRSVSHDLHSEWSAQLQADTDVDNGLHRCGGVYFARQAGEAAALRVEMLQNQTDGVECEAIDVPELSVLEPRLQTNAVRAAFLLPEETQIRPPRHLKALVAACELRGVTLLSNSNVRRIRLDQERAVGVTLADGQELTAGGVCLCGGTWTAQLLEPLGVKLPVEPWRGQMILWKTPKPLLSHIVNEGYRYFVPRPDGHLVVGATVEDEGFVCENTDQAIAELRAYSCELLPALKDQSIVMVWAGLRPGTPDGRPFLDWVPGVQNLAVACGHYRSGIHLSPATAKFMSQLLLDDSCDFDLAPFRISR